MPPCLNIYKARLKLGTVYALESNTEQNLSDNPISTTITRQPFPILPVLTILVPAFCTEENYYRNTEDTVEQQYSLKMHRYSSSLHLKMHLTVDFTQSIFLSVLNSPGNLRSPVLLLSSTENPHLIFSQPLRF